MDIAQEKQDIRRQMNALRHNLFEHQQEAGLQAADIFFQTFDFPTSQEVASYWSAMSELSTRVLLSGLYKRGYPCCLPVVDEAEPSLSFVRWFPEVEMVPAHHGILVPQNTEIVEPDILVVPLLAFDRKGHRLGFGKGHYDRALSHLRKKKDIVAIGYAYAQQEVDSLPQDQYDQALDWVITDQEAIRIQR